MTKPQPNTTPFLQKWEPKQKPQQPEKPKSQQQLLLEYLQKKWYLGETPQIPKENLKTPQIPSPQKAEILKNRPQNAHPYHIRKTLGLDSLEKSESQGHAFRFSWEKIPQGERLYKQEKRQAISRFSNASKKRLADLLAGLAEQEIHFLTLTYPPECVSKDPAIWKDDLEKFYKRMDRLYPEISFIWRLEKQQNGNPHYHILVFNVPIANEVRMTQVMSLVTFLGHASDAWQEISNNRTLPHFQPLENKIGAYLYVCGHAGKANQVWEGVKVGRYWGIKGKATLQQAPISGGLPSVQVLRLLRKYWKSQETSRLAWLRSRGRKGKRRKFTASGKYFFRIPVQIILEKSRIPRDLWFYDSDFVEIPKKRLA
jgi:hypothetical protein